MSLIPERDPATLTDEERGDLIGYALTDGDGPVTRWVVAYEQAAATSVGLIITSRSTDDPPWLLHGMAAWLAHTLLDEARER